MIQLYDTLTFIIVSGAKFHVLTAVSVNTKTVKHPFEIHREELKKQQRLHVPLAAKATDLGPELPPYQTFLSAQVIQVHMLPIDCNTISGITPCGLRWRTHLSVLHLKTCYALKKAFLPDTKDLIKGVGEC